LSARQPRSRASFWEAAKVALDSLRASKLRSFLTLLGIILSTTTLISVMAVINGLQSYIANSATTMGSEGFRAVRFAFVGNFDPKKLLEYQRKNPQLSKEEFQYLKEHVRLSREVGMSIQRGVTSCPWTSVAASCAACSGVIRQPARPQPSRPVP